MILLTHPTGNQNVRQAMATLTECDALHSFYTTLGFDEHSTWLKHTLIPHAIREQLKKRSYPIPDNKLKTFPAKEALRLLIQRKGPQSWLKHETGKFCVDAIYQHLDQEVARALKTLKSDNSLKAIYGYEDGCLESFTVAKENGLKCIYELPIAYGAYAKKILDEEAERLPEWEPTLVGTQDSDEKRARKEREIELADLILCPSDFVYQSLPEAIRNQKQIAIVPYGADSTESDSDIERSNEKLEVLFVGSMTQRKGLADCFAAMKQLDASKIHLHVLGSTIAPLEFYQSQYSDFTYHPPCARGDVLSLMRSCDLLLLPSLVEGRALVQLEALSCGLPLLTTHNAGGSDLVEEAETGFIVPIRSPESIAEKLEWFLNHKEQLPKMRQACLQKARDISWARYRAQLKAALQI